MTEMLIKSLDRSPDVIATLGAAESAGASPLLGPVGVTLIEAEIEIDELEGAEELDEGMFGVMVDTAVPKSEEVGVPNLCLEFDTEVE